MARIEDLDVSPSTVLGGMRGVIIHAGLSYPDVLHVDVRDAQGALWRFATQDADWFPEDPDGGRFPAQTLPERLEVALVLR